MAPRLTLIGLWAALAGCAGGTALDASTVLSYDQCQGIDAGLTRVDYAEVAGIRGSRLLDLSREPSATGSEEDGLLLVAISRGRQPTPGYAMTLEGARRRDTTAIIEVSWRTPESGAVLAQVMTHPCLVVGLPARGLTRLEAVDQSGDHLGSLAL